MLTKDLTGALLDYWVARAEGFKDADIIDHMPLMDAAPPSWCRVAGHPFQPSSTWSCGGPIVEREGIALHSPSHPHPAEWSATPLSLLYERAGIGCTFFGQTPLIAAMRAYVASKFGDEVPDNGDTTGSSNE